MAFIGHVPEHTAIKWPTFTYQFSLFFITRNRYSKESRQLIYTDLNLQSIDISYSVPELSSIWIIAIES